MEQPSHEISIKPELEKLAQKIKQLRATANLPEDPVSAKDLNSSGIFSASYNEEPAGSFKRVSNFLLFFINQLLSEDEAAIKKTLDNPNDLSSRFLKLATDMAAFTTTSSTVPTVIGAKEPVFLLMKDTRRTEDDPKSKLLMDFLDEFLSVIEQHIPSGKSNKLFPELIAKFKFEYRRTTFKYEANQVADEHLYHKKALNLRSVADLGIKHAAEYMKFRAAKSTDTLQIFKNWLQEYRDLFEKIKETPMEILFYINMAGIIQTIPMKRELLQHLKDEFDPNSIVGLGRCWQSFRADYNSDVAFSEQADAFEQILLEFYKQVSKQLEIQEKVKKPLKDHIKTFTDIFNCMEKMLAKISPELICKARYYLTLMKDLLSQNNSPTFHAFSECLKDITHEIVKLPIFDNPDAPKLLNDLATLQLILEESSHPLRFAKQQSQGYFNADETTVVVYGM